MKPIRLLKTFLWAMLLSLSLSAYLFLAGDAAGESTATADAVEQVDDRYHVLGDVLLLKKALESAHRYVSQ